MLRFFKDFALGFRKYWEAITFIRTHKLWHYLIIPAVLSALLFWLGNLLHDQFQGQEVSATSLSEHYSSIIKEALKASSVMLLIFFNSYVVLLLLSPLIAMLSQKTEFLVTGNHYPFKFKRFMKDIERAVKIALNNLVWQVGLMAIWFILSMLFGWGALDKVALMCIGFYFYGFSFIDYTNERLRLSLRSSTRFVRKHAGLAIALGSVFYPLFLIPFFGIVVAPILTAVAATLAMHELVDLNQSRHAEKRETLEA